MPLTVTAEGVRRTVRVLRTPSSPMASLLVASVVLVCILPALLAFSQAGPPWPLPVLFVPPCVILAALAASTVPATRRPVERAEKLLRGTLGAAAPMVGLSVLFVANGPSPMAVVAASALGPTALVAAWRAAAVRDSPPWGEGAGKLPRPVDDIGPLVDPLPPLCRLLKRAVDVVVAGTVLVLTLPVLALAAVAIVVEGRGGVFFSQTRVGRGGLPFRMYKLRTMLPANDGGEHTTYVADLIRGQGRPQGGMYKLVADDRRTRVGRVLRTFSIDELPQLWNVLRGDMSVVGPRPPLPAEVALYDEETWDRMAVKPGLTGLWQVSGRSRLSFQEMVELDVWYWREWTPLLDLRILLRTPKAVLWRRETA
ncbi:MAG TPA: sugar transferase [Acidimicrobiales bacterium]|nr:sugar transferase [Acidimicrobiales bacterium]